MADSSSKEKPNLKICIDNTESDSENEASLVLTDCSDIDDDIRDQELENERVEFNVRIGKTHPSLASTTTTSNSKPVSSRSSVQLPSKRYENKAGDFITGLDMTVEQLREKREERAKRFGLPAKPHDPKVNYEELYTSLGMKTDVRHDERGIRPEAIHVRGLDEMNTQEVFRYFQEFGPGSVEWIDDTSCNVVWVDPISAARALLKLSVSHASVEKYLKKDDKSNTNKTSSSEKQRPKSKPKGEESEDDDELDLTEYPVSKEKEEEETPMDTSETEDKDTCSTETAKKESESQEEEMEEGEISDGSEADEEGFEAYKGVNLSRVIWPPGEWRLGVPCPKAKYLFFRFATKADVKLPGAERRSKYYVRHGNPNYGGMKGLISKSRKRQHWSHRKKEDQSSTSDSKFDVKVPQGRELPDYSDVAMFTGDVTIGEREEFDRKPTRPPATAYGSEGEEREEEDEVEDYTEDEGHHVGLSLVEEDSEDLEGGGSDDDQDTRAAELELQKLLAIPRRSGRMYADDVEEEIKAKIAKRSDDPNDLTVIADIRDRLHGRSKNMASPVDSVRDARQLITGKGLDLRRRLESKRHKAGQKKTDGRDDSGYHSLRIKVVD